MMLSNEINIHPDNSLAYYFRGVYNCRGNFDYEMGLEDLRRANTIEGYSRYDHIMHYATFLKNKLIDKVENENNYEKEVNNFLKKNYTMFNLEDTKTFIEIVNKLPLLAEEKFKIINFKPKNLIELVLLIPNAESRIKKKQMDELFNYITNHSVKTN